MTPNTPDTISQAARWVAEKSDSKLRSEQASYELWPTAALPTVAAARFVLRQLRFRIMYVVGRRSYDRGGWNRCGWSGSYGGETGTGESCTEAAGPSRAESSRVESCGPWGRVE